MSLARQFPFIVLCLGLAAVGILLGVPMADAAPVAIGPEVLINQVIAGRQLRASAAVLDSGEVIVVWEGEDGDGRGIFGRRTSAAGMPLGDDIAVSTTTTDDQIHTRVAATDDGGFLVVWENDFSGADPSISSRKFDAMGVGGVTVEVVPAQMDIDVSLPEIVAVDEDFFVVVWEAYDNATESLTIRGRRLDQSGSVDGTAFDIVPSPTGDIVFKGSVAPRPGDGFALAWRLDATDRTLHARTFGVAGAADGPLLTAATNNIFEPRVAGLSDDGVLLLWDSTGGEMTRRRIAADGTAAMTIDVSASTQSETDGTVLALPGGQVAIAWASVGASQPRRIWIQILGADDGVASEVLVDETALSVSDPRLAYDAERAELIVVWTRRASPGTDQEEIYGRRYALDGLFADGFESGDLIHWSS